MPKLRQLGSALLKVTVSALGLPPSWDWGPDCASVTLTHHPELCGPAPIPSVGGGKGNGATLQVKPGRQRNQALFWQSCSNLICSKPSPPVCRHVHRMVPKAVVLKRGYTLESSGSSKSPYTQAASSPMKTVISGVGPGHRFMILKLPK